MSDEKQSTTDPTVVIATSQISDGKLKSRLTKKHALIAVISLLITGLVVTAVLVSIRMVADNNLEVLKYTLQANGVKQNVSVSENSVSYHVVSNTVEAWIVQNFDSGLQVSKVLIDGKTVCYVTALNRSLAMEPSSIPTTAPDVNDQSPKGSVVFKVVPEPIPDIAFLGSKASAMCQNIPTYHAVPDCGRPAENIGSSVQNSTSVDHRAKRTPAFCATYNGYRCACGCCGLLCGNFASTTCIVRWTGSQWTCTFYMSYVYAFGSLGPTCRFNGVLYYP